MISRTDNSTEPSDFGSLRTPQPDVGKFISTPVERLPEIYCINQQLTHKEFGSKLKKENYNTSWSALVQKVFGEDNAPKRFSQV